MKNLRLRNIIILVTAGILLTYYSGCGKKQSNEETEKKVEAVDMEGWFLDSNPALYSAGKSDGNYNGKPVFYIRAINRIDSGFGSIAKNVSPRDYLEKRIKLTGNIKVNSIYGSTGMWMRVDGGPPGRSYYGSTLSFDNMRDRIITETTEWKKYEIVLNVPKESRMIFFGLYIKGYGEVSISDFSVEVVGNDVPTTGNLQN